MITKKPCRLIEMKYKEYNSYVPPKTETMQNFKAIFSMFLCGKKIKKYELKTT